MLDQVLDFFEIDSDFDLDLMKPKQDLYSLTANIIENLKPVLEQEHTAFSPCFVHTSSHPPLLAWSQG